MTGEVIRCECCGSRVRIVSSGEGTCSYAPALPELPALLREGVRAIPAGGEAVMRIWTAATMNDQEKALTWLGVGTTTATMEFALVLGACVALARVLAEGK